MKRGFLWLAFVGASLVVIGVFLQAFSIAAYVRGAGTGALDMHQSIGATIFFIEIAVFLGALGAWWGTWGAVGLALSLPVIGFLQVILIGDTDPPGQGGWVNGLHGLGAIVVLVLAAAIAHRAMRNPGLRGDTRRAA
jgi:hypothetical protein